MDAIVTTMDANIALFVVASVAVTVAPRPDNIDVLTRGVAQGLKATLASAWVSATGLYDVGINAAAVDLEQSSRSAATCPSCTPATRGAVL